MKALAETGAELDTANPTPALIADIVRITDQVPELRVVIDHLPQLEPPADKAGRKMYETQLRELGQRPQVFVKVSEVLRRVNGREIHDLEFSADVLTSFGISLERIAVVWQRLAE